MKRVHIMQAKRIEPGIKEMVSWLNAKAICQVQGHRFITVRVMHSGAERVDCLRCGDVEDKGYRTNEEPVWL